jgi:hypothetical protein
MTSTATRAVANLVTLPPAIAHELAHVLVVLPWAAQVGVVFDMTRADAEVRVNYRENTPRWAVTAAHYAPLVSGLVIGVLAVVWLLSASLAPATAQEWLWWAVLGVWWAIYTLPSAADRDTEVDDAGA